MRFEISTSIPAVSAVQLYPIGTASGTGNLSRINGFLPNPQHDGKDAVKKRLLFLVKGDSENASPVSLLYSNCSVFSAPSWPRSHGMLPAYVGSRITVGRKCWRRGAETLFRYVAPDKSIGDYDAHPIATRVSRGKLETCSHEPTFRTKAHGCVRRGGGGRVICFVPFYFGLQSITPTCWKSTAVSGW